MTLTLELPDDPERELTAEARRRGLGRDEYAVRLLATRGTGPGRMRTGAEAVAFLRAEGVLGARADLVGPVAHARRVRNAAERRDRNRPSERFAPRAVRSPVTSVASPPS